MNSLRRYRRIDLSLTALLYCLLEAAIAFARSAFPGEAYMLSPALFIILLVMVRWGAYAIIHAALCGLVYCLLYGGTPVMYATYILGNATILLNLIWMTPAVRSRIRTTAAASALLVVSGYVTICLGRSAVAALTGGKAFFTAFVNFFTSETLGAVLTVVFMMIARRQNGLLEPQTDYLRRLTREEEERKRGNESEIDS